MVTQQYITSLFYTSMDSFLKRDIAAFDLLKYKTSLFREPAETTSDFSLERVGKLYEKNDPKHFFKLDISRENINALIKEIETNFETLIIDKAKTMAYDKNVFRSELKNLQEASVEKSLEAMDPYNDGSYIELPPYVAAISFLCQINDFRKEWLRLYEAMRLFPLKGALAYRIKTPQQCIEVLQNVHSGVKGKIDVKIFQNVFFHRTTESLANLYTLTESKILDSDQKEKAKHLYKELEDNLSKMSSEILGISLEDLGTDTTVTWVIGLRNRFILNDHPVNRFRLLVANSLFEELKKKTLNICSPSENFENIIFYLSIVDQEDKVVSQSLIDSLIKTSYNRYFSGIEPNEDGFEKLRTVYRHLQEGFDVSLSRILRQQPRLEGYKTNPDSIGDFNRGNQFWLSVLFLQQEAFENIQDFKKLVDLAFKFSGDDHMREGYLIPLYIAELIATQVLSDCKDWYESKLLNEYPDLVEVVRILTANGGEFSESVKTLLHGRVEAEWNLEIECKPFYNQDTIKYLVNFLNKSGIPVL